METQSHKRHYLVVASGIAIMLGIAICFSCAGIFFVPVITEFEIGLGQLAIYLTIALIVSFFTLPILGKLAAKVDMRIILTVTCTCMGCGLLIFSFAPNIWFFYIGAVPLGIGLGFNGNVAVPTLINTWFVDRSALFLGVCVAMTGIGGVIFNLLGGWIIETAGWRMAYLAFGIIFLAITLPFTIFAVRSTPASVGLEPFRLSKNKDAAAAPAITGLDAPRAQKTGAFYALGAAYALTALGVTAYQFFPAYTATLPFATVALGATLASVVMASQTIGKIALGAICDKNLTFGALGAIACGIAGLLCMWLLPSFSMILVGGALFGIYYAVQNVVLPQLARAAFGVRDYPTILSRVAMVGSLMGAVGATVWGFLIDSSGYSPLFAINVAIMFLVAFAAIVILRSRKKLQAEWTEASPAPQAAPQAEAEPAAE